MILELRHDENLKSINYNKLGGEKDEESSDNQRDLAHGPGDDRDSFGPLAFRARGNVHRATGGRRTSLCLLPTLLSATRLLRLWIFRLWVPHVGSGSLGAEMDALRLEKRLDSRLPAVRSLAV